MATQSGRFVSGPFFGLRTWTNDYPLGAPFAEKAQGINWPGATYWSSGFGTDLDHLANIRAFNAMDLLPHAHCAQHMLVNGCLHTRGATTSDDMVLG